jgi:hypothetical protein
MPLASVRLSHMIETAVSNFVFGLIVTWLLYPRLRPGGAATPRDPARAVAFPSPPPAG